VPSCGPRSSCARSSPSPDVLIPRPDPAFEVGQHSRSEALCALLGFGFAWTCSAADRSLQPTLDGLADQPDGAPEPRPWKGRPQIVQEP